VTVAGLPPGASLGPLDYNLVIPVLHARSSSMPPETPLPPSDSVAEIIRLYQRDVDRSLLRRQLARTPEERFRDLMDRQQAAEALRQAGREARRSP